MHILVLPSWYPTAEDPVNGCFFREQAEALAAYGHRVTVFAVYSDGADGVRTEKRQQGDLTEYLIHVQPIRFHLTYFRVLGEMERLLHRELKGNVPDVIHVHSFTAVRYARALKALHHIPFVVTEHVTWFERKLLSEKELASVSRDYRSADAVLAVSPGLKEQIRPYCADKEVIVVPNMVSDTFLSGNIHAPADGEFRFVSVGGLMRKKGFDVLLRAFSSVHEQYPHTHLTVCGGGEEREALQSLTDELHLTDAVTFTGQLSREECAEEMRRSQAFVLASRAETFGVVYVEAMACGLPVIMTKLGAWTMLAAEETGLAVEPEDVSGLAVAMEHILTRYDAYDARIIRSFCRENFAADSLCRRLTEVYRSVTQ